jgi:hypothetical protein
MRGYGKYRAEEGEGKGDKVEKQLRNGGTEEAVEGKD